MLRRLIACLALLTGLAAMGAPAHATVLETIGARLEVAQQDQEARKGEASTCAERQRRQRQRGVQTTRCRAPKPVTIYIPTVQFGPDRAFE